MSNLKPPQAEGILRDGWHTTVEDYAIACEWILGGTGIVIGDAAGGLYAFEGNSGVPLWQLTDVHDSGLLALAVHQDGQSIATAGQDGKVMIWHASNGELRNQIKLGNHWLEHLAWSPDGRSLAVVCSREVFVFSHEGQQKWRSQSHPSTVSAIAWASNTELATTCYGRVTFFDTSNDTEAQKLEWKGSLVSMVLSPNGDIVACGSQDNSVHFWRRSTAEDSMMSGYPSKPSQLAFDHSGTLLATGGGDTVTVWSFAEGGPEGTRPGSLDLHTESVTSLTFARRGKRLASGSRDGSVVIWKLRDDGEGGPIGAAITSGLVETLAWHPDGRALAAANERGEVTVWRVH